MHAVLVIVRGLDGCESDTVLGARVRVFVRARVCVCVLCMCVWSEVWALACWAAFDCVRDCICTASADLGTKAQNLNQI